MLHGQSPPIKFTHGGIQYLSPPNPYSVPWYTQQAQNQIYRPHRALPPPSQSSPIPAFNLDDDNFEPLWASASQPFQPYSEAKSEDSVEGNGKKAAGIWMEVAEHFHEEMGEDKRCYDFVNCEWKNRIRPNVSQFCEIYNSVRDRHQNFERPPKWKKVEMPKFYKSKKSSSKKSRTSKNTLQGNSDSAHIGVNLNGEAADSEDVEAQEVPAPMGRDRAKKKGSSSGARSETSIAGDPSLVDALLSKFTMAATPFFTQRKESSSEYLRIKERELELEERKRQEQGELERMRIAQRLDLVWCLTMGEGYVGLVHGELITIFGAVVKLTLDELSALWLSCSWICDALAVRQGDSSFFCFDFTRIGLIFKVTNSSSCYNKEYNNIEINTNPLL
nr:hypothetical protein [Tanacetum cinerariifolium]